MGPHQAAKAKLPVYYFTFKSSKNEKITKGENGEKIEVKP